MKLPVVSGAEAVKALGRLGYEVDVQRGSHILLRRSDPPRRRLSVPNHKELAERNIASNPARSGPNGCGIQAAALGNQFSDYPQPTRRIRAPTAASFSSIFS